MERLTRIFIPHRLYERLRCIYSNRLTVVSAPDDYGKSTIIKEFVKRSRPEGISCRFMTAEMSEDACFRRYCELILGHEEPLPVTAAEYIRLSKLFAKGRPPKQTVVVMDSECAEKMLFSNHYCARLFAEHSPANTVILCRPVGPYREDMLTRCGTVIISAKELRLTVDESREYLTLCGVTEADLCHIHSMTGGEVLRLRLSALAILSHISITSYRADNLFAKLIYELLPPQVQLSAIFACAFSRLDKELFSYLSLCRCTGEYFGEEALSESAVMEDIEYINAVVPVISINRKTGAHNVSINFKHAMYRIFLELPQQIQAELHRVSAMDFMRDRKTFRAFCQYYMAGDIQTAAETDRDEPVSFEMLMKAKDFLLKYVLECPLDCKTMIPRLLRLMALLMLTPYKERVKPRYREVISYISRSPDYREKERRGVLSYAFALRTYEDFFFLEKMGNHIKRAYELFSASYASYAPLHAWCLYSPSVFSLIHRYSIPLRTEMDQFSRIQSMYCDMIHHGEHVVDLYKAECSYFIGDFGTALSRSLEIADQCSGGIRSIPSRLCALCTAARCALMTGSYEIYRSCSDRIADIMRLDTYSEIGDMAALCLALLCCLRRGSLDELMRICAKPDEELLLNRYSAPLSFFVRCFAMISMKKYRMLIEHSEYYMQAARDVRNETALVMLQLSSATAHLIEGEQENALKRLRETIRILRGSGITMPAVEYCIHDPDLFRFGRDHMPEHRSFFENVLTAAKPLRKNIEALRSYELTDIAELSSASENSLAEEIKQLRSRLGLTESALKYAVLAARRHSNEEIADICGCSVNSVKSSLKRTYAKLGIRSRSQLRHILEI